jgi:alpha-beta hydrolase superfamily lysophospholipase
MTCCMLVVVLLLGVPNVLLVKSPISRHDFFVAGEPGIHLFAREVSSADAGTGKPILLLHGARVPGVASFDLSVAGGSLAADLAQRGFDVYIMDVLGIASWDVQRLKCLISF